VPPNSSLLPAQLTLVLGLYAPSNLVVLCTGYIECADGLYGSIEMVDGEYGSVEMADGLYGSVVFEEVSP
jgi:hypothetical protein